VGSPRARVQQVYGAVCSLTALLGEALRCGDSERPMASGETLFLLTARWRKLQRDLRKKKAWGA
jgi:hypothetical protein